MQLLLLLCLHGRVFFVVQRLLTVKKVFENRNALQEQMTIWENISKEYPTYRDAYFQAAVLAYRLGDSTKERLYLEKTLQLDPNYEPAKKLQER